MRRPCVAPSIATAVHCPARGSVGAPLTASTNRGRCRLGQCHLEVREVHRQRAAQPDRRVDSSADRVADRLISSSNCGGPGTLTALTAGGFAVVDRLDLYVAVVVADRHHLALAAGSPGRGRGAGRRRNALPATSNARPRTDQRLAAIRMLRMLRYSSTTPVAIGA